MAVAINEGYFDPGYFEVEYFTSPYFGIRDILSPPYVDRANFNLSLNTEMEKELVLNTEINFEVER